MSSLCRILTLLVAHELSASRGNIKTLWMPTVSFVQKYGFQREIVKRIIKMDPFTNARLS